MLRLAWRQMQLDPLRSVLTAVAVGAVLAVILVLEGFEQGQYYQLERLVLNRGGDLIAAQAGVRNFVAVRSSIPQASRGAVEAVAGVKNAYPITSLPIIYEKDGVRTPVTVLIYDQRGGPSSIIAGNGIRSTTDIVIDRSLAERYGIGPGDPLIISDYAFTISGLTTETAFMMPFAFISYDGMIDLYLESEIAPDLSTFPLLSYLLIELEPGADRVAVAGRIDADVPSVDVLTPEAMAKRDVAMGQTFFSPIMGLLVTVSYAIGMLVVALIMFADARGRTRSFAVMKAIGFPFRKLVAAVFLQAILLLVLALPAAAAGAYALAEAINRTAPMYLVRPFEPFVLARTAAAGAGFALLGALVPLRMVRRSDPKSAFEGV